MTKWCLPFFPAGPLNLSQYTGEQLSLFCIASLSASPATLVHAEVSAACQSEVFEVLEWLQYLRSCVTGNFAEIRWGINPCMLT